MIVRTFRTCILCAGLAATLAVSSVALVVASGPAMADSDDGAKVGKAKGHDKGKSKGKAKGHGKGKGHKKGKGKRLNKDDADAADALKDERIPAADKDDAPMAEPETGRADTPVDVRERARGGEGRDERQSRNGSPGKKSVSPSWSKRKAPPPPPNMIPLPRSTFSGSDLAPERSVRPQTRRS